jgi:AbrB family looped-hinge helix DNA binding protein
MTPSNAPDITATRPYRKRGRHVITRRRRGQVKYVRLPTTLTSKGQVTVPYTIRDYLGLETGSAVTFERLDCGEIVLRPAKARAKLRGRATV